VFYKILDVFVLGSSSERKAPLAAAIVSPSVVGSCKFDEFEGVTHVTPTSQSSGVTSSSQFSPVRSCASSASSADHAGVCGLPAPEMRRDSFPPYVSSMSKRSTAVVAPSLARTRPTPLPVVTSVAQSAAVTSLRFPTTHHRWMSAPSATLNTALYPVRSTQSLSKVMSDLSHSRYPDSISVCRSSGSRSLLAPSSAASSGISYSLALSSALASSCHSSAGQINTLSLTAGQTSRPSQLHRVNSTPSNPERREALFRDLSDAYVDHRSARDLTSLYNDYYAATQRRSSAASVAVTTVGRTTFASSHPPSRASSLARYQSYLGLNQTSRTASAQYVGPFPSSSVSSVSSQLQSLQTPPNSGMCCQFWWTSV